MGKWQNLVSVLYWTLASTVKNGFEDSNRRQKVENWRHGEQIGGTIKALLIKRRDFKKTGRWKTQDWAAVWMCGVRKSLIPSFLAWATKAMVMVFFWKVAYLHFISLFFWGFILSLHLGHNLLLFYPDKLSVMWLLFRLLWDCGSSCFCVPSDGGG